MLPYSSKVIAFEPLSVMQKRLRIVFGDRIELHGVALSDSSGEVEIRLPRGNPSWATIDHHNRLALTDGADLESHRVPMRRLDEFTLHGVGVIKIDVEGHEEAVLRGAADTLRRNHPALIIESEERHNVGAVGRVIGFLEELGYGGYFLEDGKPVDVSNFDADRDQDPANVGVMGKSGRYINNFIFEYRGG